MGSEPQKKQQIDRQLFSAHNAVEAQSCHTIQTLSARVLRRNTTSWVGIEWQNADCRPVCIWGSLSGEDNDDDDDNDGGGP